jgi:ATP-dependent phosphoenolpyruvate carboxykinase
MTKRISREIRIGSKVALTGQFLRATGQFTGPDGHARWTVLDVDRDFVTVDEPRDWREWLSQEEFDALPERAQRIAEHRRFRRGNLYVVGTLDSRNA